MSLAATAPLYAALVGVVSASALGTTRESVIGAPELVAAAGLALLTVWALVPREGRAARWRSSALAACLGALLAAVSAGLWSQRPDPWTPQLGSRVTVEGTVDGRRLSVAGRDDLLLRGGLDASG